MMNFFKITDQVNVVPLLLALARRPNIWREDTYLRDYPQGPFKDTESVILRFPDRSVHETERALMEHLKSFDQHESVDQPVYKLLPEARPIIFSLMGAVQGERLGRVMINKLRPGGKVYPHADTEAHAEYYSRFHVCLQSGPGYVFKCGGEQVTMKPGEIWYFNNGLEHEVINNAADDRISMVVDIRTSRP